MNKFIDFIIAFSLKRKYLILVVTLAVIVLGVVSFRQTPIDAFPDVTNTKVTIITQWPGRTLGRGDREVRHHPHRDSHELGAEKD